MSVFCEKTDVHKGDFWNRCTQGSFGAQMRATRKAILTDAHNGLLGNGFAQGMEQILDARNLHPGAHNPFNLAAPFFFWDVFSFKKSKRCDDNQQTTATHFGDNRRLHLESPKQNTLFLYKEW